MQILLSIVVGALFAMALYMMLRRDVVKILIGLILLGHAANLLIFTAGRVTGGLPPIVPAKPKLRRKAIRVSNRLTSLT